MFDDFKELLSAFNAHSVKYLVVGGYAVSFHAQPRATKDLDLFIKADPANARATYAALVSWSPDRFDSGHGRRSSTETFGRHHGPQSPPACAGFHGNAQDDFLLFPHHHNREGFLRARRT